MACKFALFDFVNEDNVLDIADTKQIVNVTDRDVLNNTDWDFQAECRVRWQTKGKVTISAAKIIRFGDDRKSLTEILDGLIEGQKLADLINNQERLGRGKRQTKKPVITSSDDESEEPARQIPARKQKVKSSEKKSDKDLLATLKEKAKNQAKTVNNTECNGTLPALREEITSLKGTVATLQSAIQTLEESNTAMVAAVASLSDLPSIVEKLALILEQQSQTAGRVDHRHQNSSPRHANNQIRAAKPNSGHTSPFNEIRDEPAESFVRVTNDTPVPEGEVEIAEDLDSTMFVIPTTLVLQAKKTDARKMTNDLLHGLYSQEFLANHSVTGGGVGSQKKPGMAEHEVNAITSTVIQQFPDKCASDVKFYMREKLNNAAKVLRRKQAKCNMAAAPAPTHDESN